MKKLTSNVMIRPDSESGQITDKSKTTGGVFALVPTGDLSEVRSPGKSPAGTRAKALPFLLLCPQVICRNSGVPTNHLWAQEQKRHPGKGSYEIRRISTFGGGAGEVIYRISPLGGFILYNLGRFFSGHDVKSKKERGATLSFFGLASSRKSPIHDYGDDAKWRKNDDARFFCDIVTWHRRHSRDWVTMSRCQVKEREKDLSFLLL
jgi:hypothetical protein